MNKLSWQLDYMYGLERFGVRMGLEIMQELVRGLGRPHEKFKSVHISGTNGKGSTAILTANALQEGGYKVGMYTSPHLIQFNERIRVNGQPISDDELSAMVEEVRSVVEERKLAVTFFEFTTAVAFLYFAKQEVDIVVVEVGLGGDLDATNVVHPLVAAITNIGHDHMKILGDTKKEIARHKAGIFKQGSVALTAEVDPEIAKYLEELALHQKAKFSRVKDAVQIEAGTSTLKEQTFLAHGVLEGEFSMPLLGKHQLLNAATSLAILFHLSEKEFPVELSKIQQAFAKTTWPGRLTVISENPLILIDGAHNEEGIEVLREFLDHLPVKEKPIFKRLVVAMKGDKNPEPMIQHILPLFEEVIVTEGSFEPKPAAELAAEFAKHHNNIRTIPNVAEAIATAKKDLEPNDLLLVTGSLYMIGDALTAIKRLP